MVNSISTVKAADRLESILIRYSRLDSKVRKLHDSLKDLISAVQDQTITLPVGFDSVPGAYWFQEEDLRKYRDLEDAYYKFKLAITNSQPELRQKLRDFIENL